MAALRFALLVAALIASAACALPLRRTADDDDGPDFGHYLTIKFVEGTSSSERLALRNAVDAIFETSLDSPLLQQATLPEGRSAAAAADTLAADPVVEFAVASGEYRADALTTPTTTTTSSTSSGR